MKTNKILYVVLALAGLLFALQGCSLDDRVDDLTGGYEGRFLDKETGNAVATEYYGAKLMLLDLETGASAQPLNYNTLPDGSYRNTKIYPSKYKVWALGPFYKMDTLVGQIRKYKQMDLTVSPNITLEIKDIRLEYGICATITYTYTVHNPNSISNQIGIVYSTEAYPGFRTAMNETEPSARVYKRIHGNITQTTGEITDVVYLKEKTRYHIRALGKTSDAGDYWNYSDQSELQTGSVDITQVPVTLNQGVTSATSAILQLELPESLITGIKVSYTDRDGESVNDIFPAGKPAYAANLPHDTESPVTLELFAAGNKSSGQKNLTVTTAGLAGYYVPVNAQRPVNVPLYNDENFKYSLSKAHAEMYAPIRDPGWAISSMRGGFIDWWAMQLFGNPPEYMPSNADIESYTEFYLYGGVKNLLDMIAFVSLETLYILPGDLFSAGETIDPKVDLTPLKKLKKLSKIVLGSGVALSEEDFISAGLSSLEIVKQ